MVMEENFGKLQQKLRKTEEQIQTTANNLFSFISLREKYKTERYEEMVRQVQNLLRRMKEKSKRLRLERFNYLEPFQTVDDIPELPIVDKETYDNIIVPNLIRCGAIPKDGLIKGMRYFGSCRNATEAVWNGEEFEYERCKFGAYYMDCVNHFQDDDGYDLFVPIKKMEE